MRARGLGWPATTCSVTWFAREEAEARFMAEGMSQREAHAMANKAYDYSKALDEFKSGGA